MTGEHYHRLDDKSRLMLPKELRPQFEDGLVLTRGLERNLYVFPLLTWGRLSEEIARLPITDLKAQAVARFFIGAATRLNLDRAGRFTVPQQLVSFAELPQDQDVVVVGVKTRLELWAPQRWSDEIVRIAEQSELHDLLREQLV